MKKIIIAIIVVLFLFLPECCCTENIPEEQLEVSGAANISLGDMQTFDENFDFSQTAENIMNGENIEAPNIISRFFNLLFFEIKSNILTCMKIVLVALCLGVISNFLPEKEQIIDAAFYVCYMVIFIMGINSFKDGMEIGRRAIESMDFFMKAAVPVLGSLMAASGGVAKTAVVSVSILSISLGIAVISKIVLPLSVLSAVLSGVNNLSNDFSLKGLSAMIKKTAICGMGIVMTIFTAVVTAQSFGAVNIDNVTNKTVKFAAGNFVPFVGGVVAETFESVIACGKLVKGAAGVAGMLGVMYICLTPIIKLIAIILTYKIAAIMISPITDPRLTAGVDEFASSLTIILALVISVGLMFIVCSGIIAAI